MADNNNDDYNQEDDVADKATQIGEEIGVEANKEVIPDYEVIEEGDERIAKEREKASAVDKNAEAEKRRLINRQKKEIRKRNLDKKFDEKNAAIRELQEKLRIAESRQSAFETRLGDVDRQKIDEAYNQSQNALAFAKKQYADAFAEGDGVKAMQATENMYAAQRAIEQLSAARQQFGVQQAQIAQNSGMDAAVTNKARAWAAKRPWYNAQGGDEESEIAKAISAALVKEGFDAKSDDFWDELDDRLSSRGVGNYEDDEDDEPEVRVAPARKRTAPPVSGGSQRGDLTGRPQIKLPVAYIQVLKDTGRWDDITIRNKMIKRYLDSKRSN